MTIPFAIFMSITAVSLISFSGVFLLSLQESLLRRALMYFVSFAVGALFANVFFHLLPELMETTNNMHVSSTLILLGIVISFFIEKFIHWHHCHNLNCKHTQPVGTMMLLGDGAHNITDGILIAASYLVSIELGIATTVAIALHEIPQEIGDFAVLLHSGFSRGKALLWNVVSALTAFLGGFAVLWLHEHIENIPLILLPITIGNFLYIAGSDLIPELHKESKMKKAVLQLIAMLAGIALMYLVFANGHNHSHDAHDHEKVLYHDGHDHYIAHTYHFLCTNSCERPRGVSTSRTIVCTS